MREEVQEWREGRVQQFVVNLRFHAEQLPNLSVLEGDLQDVSGFLVRERLDLRVIDLDGWNAQRRDKMTAVFDLLPALSAEHHGAR
jgi:hypothetical protein